jgi:hypothetical protein
MFALAPPAALDGAQRMTFYTVDRIGEDLRIIGRFRQP